MIAGSIARIAAAASLAAGLAVKLLPPQPEKPAGENPAVIDWLAERGFRIQEVRDLTIGGSYRAWIMEQPAPWCRLVAAPFDLADESLPLFREMLAPEAWQSARLWLGDLRPWPDSALVIHMQRLAFRLTRGASVVPALVAGPPGCVERLPTAG